MQRIPLDRAIVLLLLPPFELGRSAKPARRARFYSTHLIFVLFPGTRQSRIKASLSLTTHSFTFFSFLTTGFFSSLTFGLALLAADPPLAFLAKGFSSSLLPSGSALTSFLTFFKLLVDARGLATAFFLASGFSSSESSSADDSSSSLSSLYFGFGLGRPAAALPLDLRGAGFLAERGVSSSERSESEAGAGFWTRRAFGYVW